MGLINNVKQLREQLGISQTELGKICGVSRQTISSIERNEYNPSVVLAIKLSSILKKSVEEIFILEGE